jgi:hypothetical protein
MDTVVTDSTDSYEPDFEDLAYERYKENEFESLLQGHDELDLGLHKHNGTDRQLRNMNRERNGIAGELSRGWSFDVTTDTFDVLNDEGDHIASIPRRGGPREGVECSKFPRPLSRNDKRRAKTKQRRAAKNLKIWRTQWEKSRAASVVRKTGALPPVVAGMCHA